MHKPFKLNSGERPLPHLLLFLRLSFSTELDDSDSELAVFESDELEIPDLSTDL